MTTISAAVIADSIGPESPRLTTMLLRYPRCIHAEFMTHRVFSRNASSSRAIPVERLIADVERDPFVPLHWGKNQKGMQANEECDEPITLTDIGTNEQWQVDREEAWLNLMADAVRIARAYSKAGYHKQIVNRLLEPWAHINVLVTGTQWSNFLALRDHKDAEPHIQLLAKEVRKAFEGSVPKKLGMGEWHLPFVEEWDRTQMLGTTQLRSNETLIKVSVARCARTSYLTYEGSKPTIEQDLALYERLVGSEPLHASPAEHQATPDRLKTIGSGWSKEHLHGNLLGWQQFRKMLPNECQ